MANVQADKKFTRIANNLLEALTRAPLSAAEFRILFCVIRNSYGWARTDWPFMTPRLISEITEIPIDTVKNSIKKLRRKNLLIEKKLQKDFDKWDFKGSIPTPRVKSDPRSNLTPPGVKSDPPPRSNLTPPFKELKKGPTKKVALKETPIGQATRRIFDAWNAEEITIHRALGIHEATIRARLENYQPEEIIQAIKNYSGLLKDPGKRFSYRWTLKDFLTRPRGLDRFIPANFGSQQFAERNPRGSVAWAVLQDAIDRDRQDEVHRLTRWYRLQLGHETNPGWDAAAYETVFREAEKWHAALGPLKRTATFISQTIKRLREREGFNASWLRREVAEWGAKFPAHGRR